MESNSSSRKPVYDVFSVREIPVSSEEKPEESTSDKPKPKARWTRLGVAFRNRDDSLSVVLDALPLNFDGKLQLRVPRRNE